jgi:hypothetical protein
LQLSDQQQGQLPKIQEFHGPNPQADAQREIRFKKHFFVPHVGSAVGLGLLEDGHQGVEGLCACPHISLNRCGWFLSQGKNGKNSLQCGLIAVRHALHHVVFLCRLGGHYFWHPGQVFG